MTEKFLPPTPTAPISKSGIMEPEFMRWTEVCSSKLPILGEGSPEGVVDASQGSLYIDTLGLAGSIMYVKRDSDILNDTTKGWILV